MALELVLPLVAKAIFLVLGLVLDFMLILPIKLKQP